MVTLANPAVNGYTTDDLIEKELSLVASFLPTLVTLLIGANDMMIAAVALAGDATLVTRNQAEFRRVPGLRVAQW